MAKLINRALMTTATTGTGTITLGSALAGFQSFSDAGAVDTDVLRYFIEDGVEWELGEGTYTASGTTLTRTVLESSNADAAINLSGEAKVAVGPVAEDIINAADVDLDIKTLTLPANTTISTFGASLVDDVDQSTAQTTLGLGTGDSPQFASIELGAATDTTLTRTGAGVIAVEGVEITTNTGTQTLENKTLTHPIVTTESVPTPANGMLYLDSTSNKLRLYENSSWLDVVNLTEQGTGLITGGVLSIGTPNTTFSISDGNGMVIDHTTAPAIPTSTPVSWTGKTNLAVTDIATQLITFVGIDAAGNVVQQGTAFSNAQRRDIIVLGVIVHVDNAIVNTVNQEQHPAINVIAQLHDMAEAIGFINISGNVFSIGTSAGLYIQKSAGDVFAIGANWANSAKNPNVLTINAADDLGFQYRAQDGSNRLGGATAELIIDPDIYDVSGTFTAVPTNRWTVQRIYIFLSGDVKIQPDQQTYLSQSAARDSIATAAFVTEPSILANGLLRGFLVVREGATDLTTAEFIEAEKFGTSSGAAAATGTEFADTTFAVYDGGDASKVIAFQASGITTGTTRTITMPDADVDLGTSFDPAGTDNSTNVTLVTTSHDYLSLAGQAITLGPIVLTTGAGQDVTGTLPVANGGTGGTSILTAQQALNLEVGVDVQAYSAVLAATTASFLTADETKLDAIEALADVTDAANVVTALDGATLDVATLVATDLVLTKDVGTGNLQTVTAQAIADLAASATNLGYTAAPTNGVVTNDTGTDATLTLATGVNAGLLAPGDFTKLGAIEALADVTDTANVTAAGALMDSEVDADIKTLSLPANTTISTFGASLVDDAAAVNARTTLGLTIGTNVQAYDLNLTEIAALAPTDGAIIVGNGTSNWVLESGATALASIGADPIGTDNSTNVTLVTTSHNYLSLAGQAITLGPIVLTTGVGQDVTGTLPVANGGTGGTSILTAQQALNLEVGVDVQAYSSVLAATTASFLTADETKLDAIEALADVTDAANVVAALDGATLDTATLAATDLVLTKDVGTGNLQTVTAQAIADLAASATNLGYTAAPTNGVVTNDTGTDATLTLATGTNAGLLAPGDFTKLGAIEALADVTDTDNVTAAGALMDSEVDADIKTLALPANTTISAFGASLIDDAAAVNAQTTLGLAIGTNVQAYDLNLSEIAALAPTDGAIIVGNGTSNWVIETGATARTSLGLGTGDSPQFTGIELGHATDTTITRTGAGVIAVEGAEVTTNTGTQTLTSKTLTAPAVSNPTLTGSIVEDVYVLTGTVLEPANGTIQTKTLSANTTFTESFVAGESITLMIDDGTAYTITWPTMTWITDSGSPPTLATTGYTVIVLWKVASTLYGSAVY